MLEKFKKDFGVFHWDTFDNQTILIGEADNLEEARKFVQDRYKGRIVPYGADQVDIVDQLGNIIDAYATC